MPGISRSRVTTCGFSSSIFLQAEIAVHGGADDFDGTVGLQNLRNQLPHERGIVHHQYAHRAHERTSAGASRTSSLRSACESSIPETMPSPCLRASLAVTIHNRGKIDDQHHAAIAQDGSSADQIRGHGLIVERLDHQFFFSFETVHDQPQLAFAHGNDQHKDLSGAGSLPSPGARPRRTSGRT